MIKAKPTRGFSTLEALAVALAIVALVAVGFWVFNRLSADNTAGTSGLSKGESVDAPNAPELTSANDLGAADEALDALNLEAGNSDNAALDAQASGF